ncbi:hypothetical protein ES703_61561 [subsurface metagenome]
MGRIPEDPIPGDDCTDCWGDGKTFGDNPTPKKVYWNGSGFVGVPSVLNGVFLLEQVEDPPCQYEYNDGTVKIMWNASDTAFAGWLNGNLIFLEHRAPCTTLWEEDPRKVEIT